MSRIESGQNRTALCWAEDHGYCQLSSRLSASCTCECHRESDGSGS